MGETVYARLKGGEESHGRLEDAEGLRHITCCLDDTGPWVTVGLLLTCNTTAV
jgi:hypothetical protein